MKQETWIQDDLEEFLKCLPPRVSKTLKKNPEIDGLLEVILDLARPPEARFIQHDIVIDPREVTKEDLDYIVAKVSEFGDDNRAGIERTLHRISAIRNRKGEILGITCRVGRAVFGTIGIIEDLVLSGKSILLLGRPGVGKTTVLREVARVLADTARKRVIIVDTSNEISGDGDIPHPAIGHARRMQVVTPSLQHAVMIEAVENHMPQVIIIDEMGTELEASAARTIAERGVQLIATAHGNTLENLILNPTLSDLVGGIQTVTLGDEEAKRRRTRKTILERKAPPTFNVVVEIQSWEKVAIHDNVGLIVDSLLRGILPNPEIRWLDNERQIQKGHELVQNENSFVGHQETSPPTKNRQKDSTLQLFLFGIGRDKVEQATKDLGINLDIITELRNADIVLTTKSHYKRGSRLVRTAEESGTPIYVSRKNSATQVHQTLSAMINSSNLADSLNVALQEAHKAAQQVIDNNQIIELNPQRSHVRRLQHLLAQKYNLSSVSNGEGSGRRVKFFQK